MISLEKTISSECKFEGKVLRLFVDEVELENGLHESREYVRHGGGSCVAALMPDGRIPLVRQLRYPYREVLLEVPAGKPEVGEKPIDTAIRELYEETGIRGEDWKYMGELYPSPSYTNEVIHLFTCRAASMGNSHPDADEFLDVEYMRLEDAVEAIMAAKIKDSKTQTLILKLWAERLKETSKK